MMETVMPLLIGVVGIVLGSVLNYYILRRLFRGQVMQVLDIFQGTKTGEEIAEIVHRLNEFSKSDDAKKLLGKIEKALNDLIGDEEVKEK